MRVLHFYTFFKCDPICYFQNPYLVSKLLEVLYVINPTILDSAEALHARFMSHPISEEYLPSALMKFYTGKPKPFLLTYYYDDRKFLSFQLFGAKRLKYAKG